MTLHNVAKPEDIAKVVIIFGDPTQTHHLAHKYLSNVRKVNDVRFACFFTGEYKGKTYTFGTSGIGSSSASIYIYELYSFYKVEKIIRAGSTGAYSPNHKLRDTVIVKEAFTENSLWANLFHKGEKMEVLHPTKDLHSKLLESAQKLNYSVPEVRCHSTDVFYTGSKSLSEKLKNNSQASVVEMEAYVLFFHAQLLKKEAACLLTVVNCLYEVEGQPWLTFQEQVDVRCPSIEIILNAEI